MDSTISGESKAKAKVIGRWAMLVTGIWVTLTALAAAWLAFTPTLPWEGGPPTSGERSRTIHFDRITRLAETGDPAAIRMARAAAKGVLALEDPRGGFRRGAEKRLFDQADAVRALATLEPDAARRTLAYVDSVLKDPRGGYFSGETAGGLDTRKSAPAQKRMADAVLAAGTLATPAQQAHAAATLRALGFRDNPQ